MYAQYHISSPDINYFIAAFHARQFVLLNVCCLYYTLIFSAPNPKTNLNELHGPSPSQELTITRPCKEIFSLCSSDPATDPYSESDEFCSNHFLFIIICFNIILRYVSRTCLLSFPLRLSSNVATSITNNTFSLPHSYHLSRFKNHNSIC